jgi:hypothetical protein
MSPLTLLLQVPAVQDSLPAPQTMTLMALARGAAARPDGDVPPGMSAEVCEFWFRENESRRAFEALMVERASD